MGLLAAATAPVMPVIRTAHADFGTFHVSLPVVHSPRVNRQTRAVTTRNSPFPQDSGRLIALLLDELQRPAIQVLCSKNKQNAQSPASMSP